MGEPELPRHVRRILDHVQQAVLLVDLDGTVVHVNDTANELLGVAPSDLGGRHLRDITTQSDDQLGRLLDRWAASGDPRPGVLEIRTPGAETVTLHADGARIPEVDLLMLRCRHREAALDGFDELSRQVETRNLRAMKRRLEETIDDLRSANRKLESANEELDRYAAVVSHDLRTPLTTIAGFVDLLRMDHGDDLDADGQHILDVLERSAARMGEAIDALLQLARTKGPPEHVSPLDPSEVVHDVLEQIGPDVGDAELRVEPMPDVAVDRTHLAQVLQNLLINCLRYRSPERPLRIAVSGRSRDGMVEVTVSDTGIGIPEEERERVFEPLRRGRHVEHIEGTGIGLATCRKIVRSYGGDIAVVDRDGPGATIAFTVPAA